MNTIKSIFIHWKTSLCGIAAAGLNTTANGTSWKQIALSAAFALVGLFAKDGDK